ncbi:MAG: hypothetical protein F6K03_10590, partial [Kamptonema sp. SIO4C4]|nr:hypothetical protein [Kamptonema sp. SIO4C4]
MADPHTHCCGTEETVKPQKTEHQDSCCGQSCGTGNTNVWRDWMPIAIAVPLFFIGLIFQDILKNTPFGWAEYAVLLPAYLICGRSQYLPESDGSPVTEKYQELDPVIFQLIRELVRDSAVQHLD